MTMYGHLNRYAFHFFLERRIVMWLHSHVCDQVKTSLTNVPGLNCEYSWCEKKGCIQTVLHYFQIELQYFMFCFLSIHIMPCILIFSHALFKHTCLRLQYEHALQNKTICPYLNQESHHFYIFSGVKMSLIVHF